MSAPNISLILAIWSKGALAFQMQDKSFNANAFGNFINYFYSKLLMLTMITI